jgi:hypothetical protein
MGNRHNPYQLEIHIIIMESEKYRNTRSNRNIFRQIKALQQKHPGLPQEYNTLVDANKESLEQRTETN